MRQPLVIAGETFPSRAAAHRRCSAILGRYCAGERLSAEDGRFMADLLLRHPQADTKIGAGVDHVFVIANGYGSGPNGTCFAVRRTDGSSTDFSFIRCLEGARSPEEDFRSACRRAVVDQVLACRNAALSASGPVLCPVLGLDLRTHEAHVDHEPPDTFVALVERFVRERGIDPATVPIAGGEDGCTECRLADSALLADWQAFHRTHARLRLVSRTANLSTLRRAP